jgi:transposase
MDTDCKIYCNRRNTINAVGIDVSKGRSTVAVIRPYGEIVRMPFDVDHTTKGLAELANFILSLDGETRVVMENTGKYFEPVAFALCESGIFVCVLNAQLVHGYGGDTIRRDKNDDIDSLPEYETVLAMHAVGKSLAPQLIAEIGDIHNFQKRTSISRFAGIEPPDNQSGSYCQRSRRISKQGSPHLRKALFQVMCCVLQLSHDEPVFQFMARKCAEGKPHKVYMIAAANKFLQIYYTSIIYLPFSAFWGLTY